MANFEIRPGTPLIEPKVSQVLWFKIGDTLAYPVFFNLKSEPESHPDHVAPNVVGGCAWQELPEGKVFVCDDKVLLRLVMGILYTGDYFSSWNKP